MQGRGRRRRREEGGEVRVFIIIIMMHSWHGVVGGAVARKKC